MSERDKKCAVAPPSIIKLSARLNDASVIRCRSACLRKFYAIVPKKGTDKTSCGTSNSYLQNQILLKLESYPLHG